MSSVWTYISSLPRSSDSPGPSASTLHKIRKGYKKQKVRDWKNTIGGNLILQDLGLDMIKLFHLRLRLKIVKLICVFSATSQERPQVHNNFDFTLINY